jgi:hypothetical protein
VQRDRLPDGQHRWSLTYRVEPFVPGEAVPLQFAPVRVGLATTATTVQWPPLSIPVLTGVTADLTKELRPVTDVEAVPTATRSWHWFGIVSIAAIVIVILIGLVLVLPRRRRKEEEPTPHELATRDLDALAAADIRDAEFATRLGRTLRHVIAWRTASNTSSFTVAELLAELQQISSWPREMQRDLERLLVRLEEVEFSRTTIPTEERGTMIDRARQIVEWEPPSEPSP